jgi:hypothetical protein
LPPSNGQKKLRVDRGEIELMAAAALVINECRCELAARKRNIVTEVTAGEAAIVEWQHYPAEDAYDAHSHGQYFYHTHPLPGRPLQEHGHFHTFLRVEGMPAGVAPLLLPEMAVADAPTLTPQAPPLKRGSREEVSHLVAIAVDARGEPIRLFTTNRWVTGETWYRADDVMRMIECFAISGPEPSEAINRWIGAIIQLFRPQIGALLRARDAAIMAWRRRRRSYVFEDPALEITSSVEICLDAQLAFLDQARSRQTARPSRLKILPAMAEGWVEDHAG